RQRRRWYRVRAPRLPEAPSMPAFPLQPGRKPRHARGEPEHSGTQSWVFGLRGRQYLTQHCARPATEARAALVSAFRKFVTLCGNFKSAALVAELGMDWGGIATYHGPDAARLAPHKPNDDQPDQGAEQPDRAQRALRRLGDRADRAFCDLR